MEKKYSTSEIINATKSFLKINDVKDLNKKKIKVEQPLILKNSINKTKVNIKILKTDLEINEKILNELFIFFKKKIRKNAFRTIFEQENEIRDLKAKNNDARKKESTLKFKNEMLLNNLLKVENSNNEITNQKRVINESLLYTQKEIGKKDDEIIKLKDLHYKSIEDKDLKINELNNLNIISKEKVNKLQKDNNILNTSKKNIDELLLKLKFYREENLRLSNELFNLNKKNDNVKIQLNELGLQKNEIQNQIQQLSNLVGKTNLIVPKFNEELFNESSALTKSEDKDKQKSVEEVSSLDNKINKIFNKK